MPLREGAWRRSTLEKVSGAQAKTSLLALLYGQAKLKKTTTALAVPPEMRPVAYLDADKGARIRAKILLNLTSPLSKSTK